MAFCRDEREQGGGEVTPEELIRRLENTRDLFKDDTPSDKANYEVYGEWALTARALLVRAEKAEKALGEINKRRGYLLYDPFMTPILTVLDEYYKENPHV
jgi:hypothetical protein